MTAHSDVIDQSPLDLEDGEDNMPKNENAMDQKAPYQTNAPEEENKGDDHHNEALAETKGVATFADQKANATAGPLGDREEPLIDKGKTRAC